MLKQFMGAYTHVVCSKRLAGTGTIFINPLFLLYIGKPPIRNWPDSKRV